MDGREHELETPSRGALIKRRPHTAPRHEMAEGRRAVEAPPQDAPMDGARTHNTAPQDESTERTPEALPQSTPTEGMAGCDTSRREGTTAHEHELETPRRGLPIKRRHAALPRQEGVVGTQECQPTREHPTEGARGPDRPSRVGATERTRPLRDAPLEGAPKTPLEARGTCQPKKAPPWKGRHQPRRPFGASKTNAPGALLLAQEDTWPPENPNQRGGTTSNQATYLSPCLHHFPSPISRASCRVPRPSARPLDCQGQGRRTQSPLVASVTPSHTRRHTRPHTCALATHPAKLCQ
jgi:hypothetical protein